MNIQQNFKVGDKVFYPTYGIGIVKDTDNGSGIFPILASFEFDNTTTFTTFTRDGRDSDRAQFVSLFKGIPVYNAKTGELEKVIPFEEEESKVFDRENFIKAMNAFLSGQTISRKTDKGINFSIKMYTGIHNKQHTWFTISSKQDELQQKLLLSDFLQDDWIIEK